MWQHKSYYFIFYGDNLNEVGVLFHYKMFSSVLLIVFNEGSNLNLVIKFVEVTLFLLLFFLK